MVQKIVFMDSFKSCSNKYKIVAMRINPARIRSYLSNHKDNTTLKTAFRNNNQTNQNT